MIYDTINRLYKILSYSSSSITTSFLKSKVPKHTHSFYLKSCSRCTAGRPWYSVSDYIQVAPIPTSSAPQQVASVLSILLENSQRHVYRLPLIQLFQILALRQNLLYCCRTRYRDLYRSTSGASIRPFLNSDCCRPLFLSNCVNLVGGNCVNLRCVRGVLEVC